MTGSAAAHLVDTERDGVGPELIVSHTSARPGFWHVMEKGIDGRAWVVDVAGPSVHAARPGHHPGGAIRAVSDAAPA